MKYDKVVGRCDDVIFIQLKNGMFGKVTSKEKHEGSALLVSKEIYSFLRFMPYTVTCSEEDLTAEELETIKYNMTHNKVADALQSGKIIADHIEVS